MKPKVFTMVVVARHGVALLALLILAAALAWGCSSLSNRGDKFLATVRPASDTGRLLSNARYFEIMGRHDLALKELEEAYQLEPQNLKVVNALARAYEKLGDFERSQKIYQEALNRYGSHPALENNVCFSYYTAVKWKEAEDCFRQALARNPQNSAARNNLGLLLCRTGRQEEARRLWQEAWGEAVAQSRMSEALAALGLPESQAVASRRAPGEKSTPAARSAEAPQAATSAGAVQPPPAREKQAPVPIAAQPEARPPAAPVPPVADLRPKETPQAKAPKPAPVQAKQAPVPIAAQPEAKAPSAPVPPVAGTALREKDSTPVTAPKLRSQPRRTAKKAVAKATEKDQIKVAKKNQVKATKKVRSKVAKKIPSKSDKPYVTLAEYLGNAIEIRNGNGVKELAFDIRTRLAREGFQVARIGNYRDFGMEQTVIFYRPGAEKVAETVNARFFKTARLEANESLPGDVNLKIILGRDLLAKPQILAQSSYKWGN